MEKLNSFEALRLTAQKSKGYTSEQIAALIDTLQGIFADINDSLKTCEDHVESAHAPANAEENVIVSIKRNGAAVAPKDKIVDISVPVNTSDLTNDSGFVTGDEVAKSIQGAGHLKKLVVDALPAASAADADTIYHVRKNDGEAGDQYEQYQLINGAFELIGTKQPDLSPYAKTADLAKASDSLIENIVVNKQASSEAYIGAGNLALFWSLIQSYLGGGDLTELTARVRLLELVVLNDQIEGNPFYVTFESLDGVSAAGVWNTQSQRIEF